MRHFLLIIFLLSLCAPLSAQTSFTGIVVNEAGKTLPSVSVMLLDAKGRIVKFAKTDKQGCFSLTTPEGKETVNLSFTCVGFARLNLPIGKFKQGMKVALEEKIQEIREVTVTPKNYQVRGDTISYSVLGLRQKQDRTIEDVISRIPGIKVDVSGMISYQNIPINRFYVDGKNSMGGNYALLSKNLSANKVDSVQLLRNHQPIKSLQGKLFSEAAAINIVLDENAKNVWTGTAEVGTGMSLQKPISWMRKARLVEMFMNKNVQLLGLYKHNNIGNDVIAELGGMGFDSSDPGILQNIIPVGQGRLGFNNSHVMAINAYKSFDDSKDLRARLSGFWDKSSSTDYSEYTYLDDGNNSKMVQRRVSSSYKSEWRGNVDYMQNSRKFFLNEILNGVINFDHSNSATILNGRSVREHVRPHKQGITNSFFLHSSPGKNTLSLLSIMNYTRMPGTLRLYNGSDEELDIYSYKMENQIQQKFSLGKGFSLASSLNHNLEYKREFVSYNDTVQWTRFRKNKVDIGADLNYSKSKAIFSIKNKLSWIYASYDLDKDVRWQYTPSVDFNWRLMSFGTLRANYSHSFSQSGFYGLQPLRIYTSYNTASSGTGSFENSPSDNASVSYDYYLPGYGLSYGTRYSYNRNQFRHLYESRLFDGVYVRENVDQENKSVNQSVSGRVQYSIRPMKMKCVVSASYSLSDFDVMRNGFKMRSGNRRMNLDLSVSMRPCKWFYFEESSSYSQSWQRSVVEEQSNPIFRSFYHTLNLFFQPGNWQLKMTNECSHSKDGSVSFNIYSDAQLSYKTKAYELLLTCKNLWGENKREYKSFSALGSSYSITEYRPREIMASLVFSI